MVDTVMDMVMPLLIILANAAYGNTNYYQGYNQPAAPTQNQQPFGGKAPSS